MRVWITGATGFVGGAVARALARDGAEVHGLRRATADRSALRDVAVIWHDGDVTDRRSVDAFLAGVTEADAIVHAAGKLGQAGIPEAIYRDLNVEGTRNVLAAAWASGRRPRILHVSSPGVIGPTADTVTESAPYAPTNAYERTKAAAEEVALEFARRGLPVVIARPEFIYGPGDRHVLGLFRAIQRRQFFYIDGGRHWCHPTFIDDAVAGMLLCLERAQPAQIYHVTGPRPVAFRELGDTIANALGVRPPSLSLPRWLAWSGAAGLEALARLTGRVPPLSRNAAAFFSEDRRFSWQKANADLGYSPRTDLPPGVLQTTEWYRRHGWL